MTRHDSPVMLIGQLAAQLGINPKTVRYYEHIGLSPPPARSESGYRLYGQADLERLRFIKTAQRLGMTLDEIREILAFRDRGEPPCGFVRAVLDRQAAAIDERIAELQALRTEIVQLSQRTDQLPPSEAQDGQYCPLIHVAQRS